MLIFLSIVGVLLVIALMIIAFALRPRDTLQQQLAYNQVNLALTESRLAELAVEQQQALLSVSGRRTAEREIKLALAHDLDDATKPSQVTHKGWVIGALLLAGSVVISSYIYLQQIPQLSHWQSAMKQLPSLGKRVVMDADPTITRENLLDFALGLRTRLSQNPDDAIGWLLLGRVNVALNNLTQALAAYEKSLAIDSTHRGTTISYSQGLLMTRDTKNSLRAYQLLNQQLRINPKTNDFDLLSLLAVAAQAAEKPDVALSVWQRLSGDLSVDDPRSASVQQQIAQLIQDQTGFKVEVSLAPDVTMPESGYLFVFAKSVETGNIPLAVHKQRLTTLPVVVNLTVKNAMMEQFSLVEGKVVNLYARLSQDDKIDLEQGDLEGQTDGLTVTSSLTGVNLVIERIVK